MGIELGQSHPHLLEIEVFPFSGRKKRVEIEVLQLEASPRHPREDDQLAGHIHPTQILPRIRLGEALPVGVAKSLAERCPVAQPVHKEAQGAREETLSADYLVAGCELILEGADDGRPAPTVASK